MTASITNKQIKAVISLDPWVTPLQNRIKTKLLKLGRKNQQHLIISTDKFANYINSAMSIPELKTQEENLQSLIDNSGDAQIERIHLTHLHPCHQSDEIIFEPLGLSLHKYWRPPYSNYKELYLLNGWLMLDFLYDKGCVTNPC